jgi:hypothetical protein
MAERDGEEDTIQCDGDSLSIVAVREVRHEELFDTFLGPFHR